MRDPIGDVPPGYAVHRVGDAWLVLRADLGRDLTRLRLADPGTRDALFAGAPRRGRGTAPSVPVAAGTRAVLRRYRHGGLLAAGTRSLLLGPARPLSELRVTARAKARGAPVPDVLCVVLWPVVGLLWSGLIGTREITGGVELGTWARKTTDRGVRIEVARELGRAVRALHEAGVEHRDLQVGNVLVTERPACVTVIDLDRAREHGGMRVPAARRAQNLGRLARSVIKRGLWGCEIGPREVAAFVAEYTRDDRALRAMLRSYLARERIKLALHRLTWWVRLPRPQARAAAPPRPA